MRKNKRGGEAASESEREKKSGRGTRARKRKRGGEETVQRWKGRMKKEGR